MLRKPCFTKPLRRVGTYRCSPRFSALPGRLINLFRSARFNSLLQPGTHPLFRNHQVQLYSLIGLEYGHAEATEDAVLVKMEWSGEIEEHGFVYDWTSTG